MTSARTTNAQHLKNARATILNIEGRPSPPEEAKRVA
jgi:hypothetical protein